MADSLVAHHPDVSPRLEERAQRAKLLEAMVQVVADKGYAAATVADAVRLAQVSRGTFYELFDSKQACLVAAYRLGSEVLEERISAAVRDAPDWREELRLGLRTYLQTLSAEPRFARVHLLEWEVLGAEREAAIAPLRAPLRRDVRALGPRARAARRRALRAGGRHRPARALAHPRGRGRDRSRRHPDGLRRAAHGRRRNRGPDLRRARARLPRRAAPLARRQPARPRARRTATRTPTTPGAATGSAASTTAAGPRPHWPAEYGGRGATLTRVGDLLRGARPRGRAAARQRARAPARRARR